MYRKIFYVFIVGVFALGMTMVPALASNLDLVVNSGEVMSETAVHSGSNSGANMADGSYGGDGGDGGDIRSRGEVEESSTGRGGDGGDSNTGGEVYTGAALAVTDASNEIGNSRTTIDRCACDNGDDSGTVIVLNRTRIMQGSFVGADANTGANMALGSEAGDGGDGGTIGDDDSNGFPMITGGFPGDFHDDGDLEVEECMTGDGGNGGTSGPGGLVQSGDSTSRTTSVNVLSRNITRILR